MKKDLVCVEESSVPNPVFGDVISCHGESLGVRGQGEGRVDQRLQRQVEVDEES